MAVDTSEKENIENEKEGKQQKQTQERKECIQRAKIGGCSKLQNLSSGPPQIPTFSLFNLWRNLWKSVLRQAFDVPKETQGVIYPAQMNDHPGKGEKSAL